jgi:hypothetical protein
MGPQYRICYKKGAENKAADALSRRVHSSDAELFALSEARPAWLEEVVTGYAGDEQVQKLLAELAISQTQGPFSLQQGLIRFKGRIWLGNNIDLQQKVLSALHDSPVGGHSGFPVTYARVCQHFAWPKMKMSVREHVQSCSICQQSKPDRSNYPGLL